MSLTHTARKAAVPAHPRTRLTVGRMEAYFPDREVGVAEVGETYGLNPRQIRVLQRMHGLDRLRHDPDMSIFDLLLPAARRVVESVADSRLVKYVIYVHTTQEVTPSYLDAARIIRDSLGLAHAQAFALTEQACATPMAAVEVAGELLRSEGEGAQALLVTGDKAFTRLNQMHYEIGDLMGDGATACLVSWGGSGDEVRSYAFRIDGAFADTLTLYDPVLRQKFIETSMEMTTEVVEEALARAGVTLAEIDHFVPSNISRAFWLQAIKRIGVGREKVFLGNLARYSHCYAADTFINLATMRSEGIVVPGQTSVLTMLGLGGIWSAMVVSHGEW